MKVMLGNHLEEYLHQHHYNTISLELDTTTPTTTTTTTTTRTTNEKFRVKPRMPEPRVIFSRPENTTNYTKYLVDDITIFVSNNIEATDDEIEILDQVVDGVDTCHVRGWIGYNRK